VHIWNSRHPYSRKSMPIWETNLGHYYA